MKPALLAAALTLVSLLVGCTREPTTTIKQITGIVQYQTPINFESGATLELRLTDVSADDEAVEIAKSTVTNLKSLPYQYALPYDASKIDAERRYTVDARIAIDNTLRFATDSAYAVLTQGNGATPNITVIVIGENAPPLASNPNTQPGVNLFHGELRRDREITLYTVGMQDDHIVWLEEDRSNGTPQTLHARYEFKGALIVHYADTSPMEVTFDERGRPTGIVRNGKQLSPVEQTEVLDAVRNRAALLRSHALSTREPQAHRQATGG
jgi:putative lipoprotein